VGWPAAGATAGWSTVQPAACESAAASSSAVRGRRGNGDEEAEVDSYAVGWIVDEKVVAPDAGYEISDCLT